MQHTRHLLELMARLRHPQHGCAWDMKQDFASVAPYTLEEAYEVADAIARADFDDLRQELGDLLLQVVFHAQMAQEAGLFDFEDVAAGICDKLLRRHPHVFAGVVFDTDAQRSAAWEAAKAAERTARAPQDGILAGVALALPALKRAKKAATARSAGRFRLARPGAGAGQAGRGTGRSARCPGAGRS